jgi:3-oxoacyl-[acyl-carrier-protein] synthase I
MCLELTRDTRYCLSVQFVRTLKGYPITAHTACSALGMDSAAVLSELYAGRTGLKAGAYPLPMQTSVGALPDAPPRLPAALAAYDSRLARMAVLLIEPLQAALATARQRWGAARIAIVVSSSTAGLEATELAYGHRQRFARLPENYSIARTHAFHALTDVLRGLSGATGAAYVVSTACASGNKVFGSAQRLLDADVADAVLVGGIDTLCQVTLRGFHSLGILSSQPCRPFGAGRDGTSIGEGGALLLIERRGDAAASLLGVGETCDAHHMTQPLPDGAGALAAMQAALQQAGLEAEQIDHVNAHGTGTPLNDEAEARALEALFGARVPIASTKGFTGHMLGAGASIEAVFALAALERGTLPQSLGADPLDPKLKIRALAQATPARCRYVLSNAFAFGGSNAAVVFGAAA